ncbi:polysaccharide lyase family 7 protein [Exilibacterium tricleocarpae]|uniref:Polysaccharide lyase family 7 protein n=1 Tax=Exilibacterium tricleocarpae TaxID=2591008 RepID=A0A545SQM4_9GAMM|nr:polysaccharide lyase family 7 protein [Exilibacterium tricleocarpae]TQV67280.1 polysaccharide lyase family 7 protein [Exilibacterium tricleocarpae]
MSIFRYEDKNSLSACVFTALLAITSTVGFADSAPYLYGTKYRAVLDDSKLQAPTSATLIRRGDFNDPDAHNSYFYIPDSGNRYMTFTVSGASKRSELRQMEEWYTSDPSWNKLIGTLLAVDPLSSQVDQLTFMQIHDSESLNKPLVRLTWRRSRSGKNDHNWAVIRDSAGSSSDYTYVDMGPRSDAPTKFEIKVRNNLLTIKVDGITFVDKRDVSYWQHLSSYFKAGVYLQDSGTGTVQFKSLKYYYQ